MNCIDWPAGTYDVIYADPPWRYGFSKVRRWGIEVHYETATAAEIAALPVKELAAATAVLFLWSPSPKLAEAIGVMAAWGFDYKTSMIWDKGGLGMGYWVRVNHELLLIGTRGKPPVPEVPDRPCSVLRAKRRRHSQKPDELYEVIAGMCPDTRKIELFARQRQEGWTAWGEGLHGTDAA